jgi:putative transposase
MSQRRAWATSDDEKLSIRKRCEMLNVCRSSLYYEPCVADADELALMRRMDELHLEHPFFGSRMLTQMLKREGVDVNRKHVQRLMRAMGLESLAPKPSTSKAAPEHPVYPYLLRGLSILRVNHVWAADITYVPMAKGYCYLMAVIDWYSRRVLSWRLSRTMETAFCVEALEEALAEFDKPEIFNTDQGSQFTSDDFTGVLLKAGVRISMDGKGRCIDNVFVERLWRSLKYEDIYLNDYSDFDEASAGIGSYFEFFNTRRPHSSLGHQTPASFYESMLRKAA